MVVVHGLANLPDWPATFDPGRRRREQQRQSNGLRVRFWKLELQGLADEVGMQWRVRHFPPGTNKWNKIEHRLFRQINESGRSRPLVSRMAVVELTAATRTAQGLVLRAELDEAAYTAGHAVTDE